MARQPRYQRKLGKDGKPYYFELKKDNRGVTRYVRIPDSKGVKKFVEKNYDKLKNIKKSNLSKKEQASLNRSRGQKNTIKYDGVRIPKKVINFLQKENVLPPTSKLPKDLKDLNLPNVKRPSDIVNAYNRLLANANLVQVESKWGLQNYRYRKNNLNLYKLSKELQPWTQEGFSFVVVADGTEYSGNEAYERLRKYEIASINLFTQNQLNAFVVFNYELVVDPFSKEIIIKLADVVASPMQSDPINRTS